MNVDLSKEDLVSLVMGKQPETMDKCHRFTGKGLMDFTGNQWNESWEWNKKELVKLSEQELYDLYKSL